LQKVQKFKRIEKLKKSPTKILKKKFRRDNNIYKFETSDDDTINSISVSATSSLCNNINKNSSNNTPENTDKLPDFNGKLKTINQI